MKGAEKGKSCRGEGGSLLFLIFAEQKFEGRSLELGSIRIGKPLHYEGI